MNCSVIIPTINRKKLIARALESIPSSIRVIVVDDGSTLVSWQQVKAICDLRPNLLLLRQSVSKGAAAARNLGAEYAQTEWLCFLDDDDILFTDFFVKTESLLKSHPNVNAWLPDIKNCSSHSVRAVALRELQITNRAGGCSGLLIRKSYFEAVEKFDESFVSVQDWDLWLRISRDQSLYFSGILGVLYNTESDNKITYNLKAKYSGLRRLYFKHASIWEPRARRFHLIRCWALRQLLRQNISGFFSCLKRIFGWPVACIYYLKWYKYQHPIN